MSLSKVWVYAESDGDKVKTITLEMLAKAREVGGTVECFYGGDASAVAETLGKHGATKVYATGDLGGGLPGVHVGAAMAEVIKGGNTPELILFGTTYDGRDVAARLSVKIDKPVLSNNTEIDVDGDSVVASTPVFGGTQMVRTKLTAGAPNIVLVRPKSFAAEESGGGAAAVESVTVPDVGASGAAKVTDRHVEEATGPKLDEAAVVVSGGRGLGSAEKYEMVEQLAKLLKGAPGASRAIVDAGWVPYSHQVGQTGKVVKPNVYIALGISGATQHMVGMKGSKNIIAVNKDAEAPIFSISDLGIVGDVHKVVPKLIEALQAKT
jgi:electron transfer flavoprotein alpha subunit